MLVTAFAVAVVTTVTIVAVSITGQPDGTAVPTQAEEPKTEEPKQEHIEVIREDAPHLESHTMHYSPSRGVEPTIDMGGIGYNPLSGSLYMAIGSVAIDLDSGEMGYTF